MCYLILFYSNAHWWRYWNCVKAQHSKWKHFSKSIGNFSCRLCQSVMNEKHIFGWFLTAVGEGCYVSGVYCVYMQCSIQIRVQFRNIMFRLCLSWRCIFISYSAMFLLNFNLVFIRFMIRISITYSSTILFICHFGFFVFNCLYLCFLSIDLCLLYIHNN